MPFDKLKSGQNKQIWIFVSMVTDSQTKKRHKALLVPPGPTEPRDRFIDAFAS